MKDNRFMNEIADGFCTQCGKQVYAGNRFCMSCGAPLKPRKIKEEAEPVSVSAAEDTAEIPLEKMYCEYCGAEIDTDSVFCIMCGMRV